MKEFGSAASLQSGNPQDVVLGIDQSLTGFGLTVLSTTTDDFVTWVYKSPYRGVDRLADIQDWILDRIDLFIPRGAVTDAAMESGVLMSNSALVLGELSATVKLTLRDHPMLANEARYPLQVPPTSLKKFVTGRGNANKQEVVLAAYKHWGAEFTDDNAADSYSLARLVRGGHILSYQKETHSKLTSDPKYRDPSHHGLYGSTHE